VDTVKKTEAIGVPPISFYVRESLTIILFTNSKVQSVEIGLSFIWAKKGTKVCEKS
jgi:hypothetical protein